MVLTGALVGCAIGTTAVLYSTRETGVNNNHLVGQNGKLVETGKYEEQAKMSDIMSADWEKLHTLDAISFSVEDADGEEMQVMMNIGSATKSSGVTTLFSTCGNKYLAMDTDGAAFTDVMECKADAPCAVVIPTIDSEGEVDGDGRRLFWGSFWGWFTGGDSGEPTYDYAASCESAGGWPAPSDYTSDTGGRWEYTSCTCRFRWWNCGEGTAKHIRQCGGAGGRFNVAVGTCQDVPRGTPA